MITPLLVAVGGGAGAAARYLVTRRVTGRRGTLLVDVVGSTVLGVLLGVSPSPSLVALVGVGFCGAFTTFSSVAVETNRLLAADDPWTAIRFVAVVALAAIVGAAIGQFVV